MFVEQNYSLTILEEQNLPQMLQMLVEQSLSLMMEGLPSLMKKLEEVQS